MGMKAWRKGRWRSPQALLSLSSSTKLDPIIHHFRKTVEIRRSSQLDPRGLAARATTLSFFTHDERGCVRKGIRFISLRV
jgi:hypothetical protein